MNIKSETERKCTTTTKKQTKEAAQRSTVTQYKSPSFFGTHHEQRSPEMNTKMRIRVQRVSHMIVYFTKNIYI